MKCHAGRDASLADTAICVVTAKGEIVRESRGGCTSRGALSAALESAGLPPEPATGLDVSLQALVLDTLKRLRTGPGTTMIRVSHDLEGIRTMADRVLVMRHGRVVERRPADQFLQDPQHACTRQLVFAKL